MHTGKSIQFITLALIVFAVDAFADEVWSDQTAITVLYPTSTSLVFNTAYSNSLSTCDNGRRYVITMSNPNYAAMASSLIAAFYSGKTIKINFNDSQGPQCAVSINRFFVYP